MNRKCKIEIMSVKKGLLDFLLTLLILCLPFFREQYNGGQYVTWHRPIVVIGAYVQELHNRSYFGGLLLMLILSAIVYLIVSFLTTQMFRLIKKH